MQTGNVKRLVRFTLAMMFLGPLVASSPAAFSSFYIFGDGTCTTTGTPTPAQYYYGKRYCNGRIWIEVLAQRQGLAYDTNKNVSFFGHTSAALLTNINAFVPPLDASNSLFVVWVCDADFVGWMNNPAVPYTSNNMTFWNTNIAQSI